ncbi:putative J domain-containing protein-like protein [Emericellopsis cladophorae]|uniref:J domain-containing protein-like protein n=1 Tax=Emericellopsis cladophorae TaxID=2686198 RepID=A0A9P9Y9G8_9HYPO|nr:putative J domain-containing protein-like protein [Emericellopsis cladophorae]KAI6785543.1 putative J domain-containing protein-like protein [Emericellopsis cladophorae]
MKVAYFTLGLLALVSPVLGAWSKEDREIFRIRDEISAHETDQAATFYDILGIKQSASIDDITKAYRLKTRSLHPDKVKQNLRAESKKNPGQKAPTQSQINAAVKQASAAQARLSLIANILRSEGRDRYDHFLANGFPLWKGTDYYYNRYRPGIGTVLTGVFLLGGGLVHYIILYMGWKKQKEFVERYVKFARDTAWGAAGVPVVETPAVPTPPPEDEAEAEDGPPQPMNRKQRRMQEKDAKREGGKKSRKAKGASANASRDASPGPTGRRKRVVAENGKILVVDELGDVYLEDEDDEGNVNEFLLDPNEIAVPGFKDTAVVRLPLWLLRSTFGRLLPQSAPVIEEEIVVEADESDEQSAAQRTPSSDSDFEMLDKSTDSLARVAKATGAQSGGKASKRKNKKR